MADAYGPLSREEFQKLVEAPFGQAADRIRQIDPMWGRAPGEKIKWKVTLTREITEEGTAYVEAESEEEAEKLVDKLDDNSISWDYRDTDPFSNIESIEPVSGNRSR